MYIITTRKSNGDGYTPSTASSYKDAHDYMYTEAAKFFLQHKGLNPYEYEALTPGLSKLICKMAYEIESENEMEIMIFDNRIKFIKNHEIYFDIEVSKIENIDNVGIKINTKFELSKKHTLLKNGKELYRIIALKDFSDIKKGEYGGYVEKESNLSQEGNCWLYNKSIAKDNSSILGDAKIYNDAIIEKDAIVCHNALVKDKAKVSGNAVICDEAFIKDNAVVYGIITGQTIVDGHTVIDSTSIFNNGNQI